MKHSKHSKLVRPDVGFYSRIEYAIYGSNCGMIRELMDNIVSQLDNEFSIYSIDADHNEDNFKNCSQLNEKIFSWSGNMASTPVDDKLNCGSADIALVNGNHYPAKSQIVIIDPQKRDSLERRKEQLNDVKVVVSLSEEVQSFEFLEELLEKQTHDVIRIKLSETKVLSDLIRKEATLSIPSVKGLILAGGKSTRMGSDKSTLNYHGKPQEQYLAGMVDKMGLNVAISKRIASSDTELDFEIIHDTFTGLGPFGAICTAFQADPNKAYLVIACDLPMVDAAAIEVLLSERDPSKIATCFKSQKKDFPDPLFAIYEPRAYQRFLAFLSQGHSCPRKVLINSDVKVVELEDDTPLINVNTKEDYEKVLERLS